MAGGDVLASARIGEHLTRQRGQPERIVSAEPSCPSELPMEPVGGSAATWRATTSVSEGRKVPESLAWHC
jgi:hypothetical protein